MSLMDRLRGELIDIVQWLDDSRDTIVWRFPRYNNEIKMGAKLVVRESQTAVFVNEGTLADVFPPGTYELRTQNMPILATLKGWKYGFESPFKAEVYFVNTRQFTDMKWGTQNPVIVRDPEFGAVRLRAFGAYSARVVDPPKLLRELVGTDPQFRTEEVQEYLRQVIVGRLGSALASSGVPMLDLATQQGELGNRLAKALSDELSASIGIAIPKFIIENISLPPEVEQALDKRTQMGIVGNLDQYTQFQAANALQDAARNPGGGASEGIGIGLGLAAGQRMASMLNPTGPAAAPGYPTAAQHPAVPAYPAAPGYAAAPPTPPAAPPPLPVAEWYVGIGGQQQGPLDVAGLRERISRGEVTVDTLVWKSGMAQWLPVHQVPEVAGLLTDTPPPLPPQ
jgi:membrane protease subunit (stomatin/prohibitin family)